MHMSTSCTTNDTVRLLAIIEIQWGAVVPDDDGLGSGQTLIIVKRCCPKFGP
jgi:hypothetical protein